MRGVAPLRSDDAELAPFGLEGSEDVAHPGAELELVVEQVNGRAEVKEPHLRALYDAVSRLADEFKSIRFAWVPREMNAEADALVRAAFAAHRASAPTRAER